MRTGRGTPHVVDSNPRERAGSLQQQLGRMYASDLYIAGHQRVSVFIIVSSISSTLIHKPHANTATPTP